MSVRGSLMQTPCFRPRTVVRDEMQAFAPLPLAALQLTHYLQKLLRKVHGTRQCRSRPYPLGVAKLVQLMLLPMITSFRNCVYRRRRNRKIYSRVQRPNDACSRPGGRAETHSRRNHNPSPAKPHPSSGTLPQMSRRAQVHSRSHVASPPAERMR